MPFQVDENDLSFINQVERSWEEFKRPEWRTYTPRSSAGLLEQVQQVLANAQTNQPTPRIRCWTLQHSCRATSQRSNLTTTHRSESGGYIRLARISCTR